MKERKKTERKKKVRKKLGIKKEDGFFKDRVNEKLPR